MTDTRTPSLDQVPDDSLQAARWLLDRHPVLRRLLERVPGFIDDGGRPDVDLLAGTLRDYEENITAWHVYATRSPAPWDEREVDAWRTRGPAASQFVQAIAVMSSSERARLRMLATFSIDRVPVSIADFASLDARGRALLTDWTIAVRSAG